MTGFNLDFSKATQGGGKIKDGTYEVVVKRANEDATPGGAEYLELDLIIRNDVNQDHQNQHIFAKVWKKKDTGQYNEGQVMKIAEVLQLQDGKQYNSFEELLEDFALKTALVTVKLEKSRDGKYENLEVKYWDKTNTNGIVNHQFKTGDTPSFSRNENRNFEMPAGNSPF